MLNEFSKQVPSPKVTRFLKQLEDDFQYIENNVGRLAEMGWTIDPDWPFPFIGEILEFETINELDEYLYGYFTYNKKVYLKEIFQWLKVDGEEVLSHWNGLILDCISSYKKGYYKVCIPSIISIIEGVMALRCENKMRSQVIYNYFDSQIEKYKNDNVNRIIWVSCKSFFSNLFKGHDFNSERLPLINRHWIEHGRDNCNEWKEIDAIRLFHALKCIAWVLKKVQM